MESGCSSSLRGSYLEVIIRDVDVSVILIFARLKKICYNLDYECIIATIRDGDSTSTLVRSVGRVSLCLQYETGAL